ncbi:MAG: cyclodeaminase/cyclohydrolase family protein [bacterium]|nr:cyclodeaminase/cyclohydrolase family protein [bacterium]
MLTDLTITDFLKKLGSQEPAPGGGSSAALAASLGANLLSMVCQLTAGKKGYEEYWDECKGENAGIAETADRLRVLIDEDTEAFNALMASFKLPKESPEEMKARNKEIQKCTKRAIEVPLEVARLSRRLLTKAPRMALIGNQNAISDIGVGALLLTVGINGAILNVEINLGGIKDEGFVREMRDAIKNLLEGVPTDLNAAMAKVHERL